MSSTQPYDRQWADRPDFGCKSYAEGPGFTRVTLSGELDLATAPKLRDELAEAARGSAVVILDLSELTFMDSTGLHVIFSARARLAEAGRRLVVVPGSQQVQQIFEITGTKHHFEFFNAPNAPRPATVRSGTEAFLHAHLSRRKTANDRTFGADHPSADHPSELAVGERPSATHPPLNSGGVDRDRSEQPIEGGALSSRSKVGRLTAVLPHGRFVR